MSELDQYRDLTEYSHQIDPFFLRGVKNVGWLDIQDEYPKGEIRKEILEKLKFIINGFDGFDPILEPIRESPICRMCGKLELLDIHGKFLPRSEIWIPSGDTIYAAPIEIFHYISFHNYEPPKIYIQAIDNFIPGVKFVADEVYRLKLKESGWFDRLR